MKNISTIIHTECPLTYLSPIEFEMNIMAKRIGIDYFCPRFIKDLAHKAAGGRILLEKEWKKLLTESVNHSIGLPDRDGKWLLKQPETYDDEPEYTTDKNEVVKLHVDNSLEYHRNICDFITNIDFTKIPGRSPLEKAMNILKLLSEEQGGQPEYDNPEHYDAFDGDGSSSDSQDNETKGTSQNKGNQDDDNDSQDDNEQQGSGLGKDVADKVNERMDKADSITDEENELLDAMDNQQGKRYGKQAGVGTTDDLKRMELATDMDNNKNVWLDISRTLDKEVKMEVAKSVKVEPDRHGDQMRIRPIEHFGEIPRIQSSEYALPKKLRDYRTITQISPIRERVKRTEKQQLLYMIIDCSGSMGHGSIAKAGGVLMNRLKAVIQGEAQMYIRFFDERLFPEHFADTPNKARELVDTFKAENFSGGGTDIVYCVHKSQKRIQKIIDKNESLMKPELVVVTDGEDNTSSLKKEDFPDTKVHCFVVNNTNSDLTDFAISTGGVGINL